ncbi:hypothetical protein EPO05_03320 [Patescibacteria group bacterium]|nr:MAG: hypothetical protein EPO05_03320 [Patescibacteria group bacterium]
MQFSDESIDKFQILYKQHFGVDLDRKTAFEYAQKLYRAMELTYVQISQDDFEKLQKRREQTKDLTT